ncbi:hypothetical protein Bca101_055607 [Brassica carinata]
MPHYESLSLSHRSLSLSSLSLFYSTFSLAIVAETWLVKMRNQLSTISYSSSL